VQYDAVVLAGGRSRRMKVADKTRLRIGNASLLDRVLVAVSGAGRCIVVGEPREVVADVVWTREEPPGAGPAAAVLAALDHVAADVVVLVAGDMPLLEPADVERLVGGVAGDGAVYVDADGYEQWLCSAWRAEALRNAGLVGGGSMRSALAGLDATKIPAPASVLDCDTPDDLTQAEEMLP